MKQRIEIGILYSRSGNYRLLSEACRDGAMHGIATVNADPASRTELVPIERDPEGQIDRYAPLCEDILRTSSARHVVGCITSWSRKEVIPVLEKTGGTLWYACPYEGFESNEHVVYMNACPNQHLVPLLGYIVPRFGRDAFLVGSNYIWGWETNRVARDLVSDAGGQILGERYLPLGDVDVGRLIDEIRATRPSFILNHLIGPSSYAFFAAYEQLTRDDPWFSAATCPILSCNLTEIELPAIGDAAQGHIAVGPFFDDGTTRWPQRTASSEQPVQPRPSSFFVSAFSSVIVLADMMSAGENQGNLDFAGRTFATPFGPIAIDPQTQHASLPVKIGRVAGQAFEVVEEVAKRIDPDPYLSRYDPLATFGRPNLRAVS
ncbi:transporter substrate-binding protein [Aurantimonas marina]|uniref:transporter substrate-binding protein n=1 Tax=Aurantimonas marina TaxID=2780508 RepID=UPI0019D00B78